MVGYLLQYWGKGYSVRDNTCFDNDICIRAEPDHEQGFGRVFAHNGNYTYCCFGFGTSIEEKSVSEIDIIRTSVKCNICN